MISRFIVAASISALGLSLALGSAQAAEKREYIYGSWVSPKHGVMKDALPHLFKGVEKDTGGAIKWKMVAGGQLVRGKSTLGGIRDNLIDAGFGIAPFTPTHLPSTNLVFNTQIFGNDIVAATGAAMETILLNCAECVAENKKNNAVALAGYLPSPYMLMCRDDVKSLADLKGKKVRSSGGGVSLMKLAGATPVGMTPAQATTALQRGAIDCVLGSAAWLRSYGYQDVVKSVLDYPMGMAGPAMAVLLNRKVWKSFTPAQRQAHMKYMPRVVAHSVITVYVLEDAKILKGALAKGVKRNKGGKEFDVLVAKQDKSQRARNIKTALKHGVKNPAAILDAFAKSLVKWKRLSKDIGYDIPKYEAALKREIYDKIDLGNL